MSAAVMLGRKHTATLAALWLTGFVQHFVGVSRLDLNQSPGVINDTGASGQLWLVGVRESDHASFQALTMHYILIRGSSSPNALGCMHASSAVIHGSTLSACRKGTGQHTTAPCSHYLACTCTAQHARHSCQTILIQ